MRICSGVRTAWSSLTAWLYFSSDMSPGSLIARLRIFSRSSSFSGMLMGVNAPRQNSSVLETSACESLPVTSTEP